MAIGIEDATTIDLVTADQGEVALIMVASNPWTDESVLALQSKTQAYLHYIDSGALAKDYPQSRGLRVRLQLDAAHPLSPMARRFVEVASEQWLQPMGMTFLVTRVRNVSSRGGWQHASR